MTLKKNGFSKRHLGRKALLAATACVAISGTTWAQSLPTTPCDPEYMDALEARAYLEAQREVAQNQNFILKPDSVLEYTCFDMFLGHFASDNNWGSACDQFPFTDSCRWGSVFMQGNNTLWGSINSVVISALKAYLRGEFSWDDKRAFLYGRAKTLVSQYYPDGNQLPVEGANTPYALGNTTPPPDTKYGCDVMNRVWTDAHCYNFWDKTEPLNHDGFYDFFWYSTSGGGNNDPRVLDPTDAQGWTANTANGGGNSCRSPINDTNDIEVAFNTQGRKYVLQPDSPWSNSYRTDTTTWSSDPIVTHLDLILPENGGAAPVPVTCNNVQPIPTGICVVRSGWTQVYMDAVCPNPGCYYVPGAGAPGAGADPANCGGAAVGTCAGP